MNLMTSYMLQNMQMYKAKVFLSTYLRQQFIMSSHIDGQSNDCMHVCVRETMQWALSLSVCMFSVLLYVHISTSSSTLDVAEEGRKSIP